MCRRCSALACAHITDPAATTVSTGPTRPSAHAPTPDAAPKHLQPTKTRISAATTKSIGGSRLRTPRENRRQRRKG
jgi:hypothetical protein